MVDQRPSVPAAPPLTPTNTIHADGEPAMDRKEPADEETLQLVEETLLVGKRQVRSSTVRVSTHTTLVEETAEVVLDHRRVEVTRLPIDRVIETAPEIRTEGDVTIIPVLEERFVVVKQLVLVEEVHVRQLIDQEISRTPVTLRRQEAVIERGDPEGGSGSDVA